VSDGVRYALSFVAAFAGTLVLTPIAARIAHRIGLLDRPDDTRKSHAGPTPYLGGIAVMLGLVAVGAVSSGFDGQISTVLAGAVVLGAVGLRDDFRTVSPWIRIGVESAASVSLWLVGIRAGVFNVPAADLALTVLWVVTVVNAFNMIDNMDGLASGVAAASALGVGAVTATQGDYIVAAFAFAVAGASLGFLRYNFPPARIFLGDAGSMLLGFLIAALTLHLDLLKAHTPTRIAVIVLLTAVPLFDLSIVVIARLLGRRRLWLGGSDHTSHRLKHNGSTPIQLAVAFAGAQVVTSALAWTLYDTATETATWWVIAGGAATWVAALVVLLKMPHPIPATAGSTRDQPLLVHDADIAARER
jgi:UDP-GlcNAc:undecaprenyl-phosphate GlcNAc-1-phosphate transferase